MELIDKLNLLKKRLNKYDFYQSSTVNNINYKELNDIIYTFKEILDEYENEFYIVEQVNSIIVSKDNLGDFINKNVFIEKINVDLHFDYFIYFDEIDELDNITIDQIKYNIEYILKEIS